MLVVDDESVLAEMVSMALRYEGWNIATAADGAAAIAAARAERPDVVVLDVMLPDMSGLDVLPRLRENPFKPPALYCSPPGRRRRPDRQVDRRRRRPCHQTVSASKRWCWFAARCCGHRRSTTVDSGAQIVVGDLVLDEDWPARVTRAGDPVVLTSTEFESAALHDATQAGAVKAQILDRVWSYDFWRAGPASSSSTSSYLRKKIDSGAEPMIHGPQRRVCRKP